MKLAATIAALAVIIAVPASAQQPTSPSAVAIQIDNVINQWAQQLEADQRTIAALQKENAELKAAAMASPKKPEDKPQ